MAKVYYKTTWDSVAKGRPQIKKHIYIHRRTYRGEQWYVLQDNVTGHFYRFPSEVYEIIAMMDGTKTVQELWNIAQSTCGEDAPSRDEMIQLLSQLYSADILLYDVSPDKQKLLVRNQERQRTMSGRSIPSPLFIKIPLFDPDPLLAKTIATVKHFFSLPAFLVWLAMVCTGLIMAWFNWSALSVNIVDRILTRNNLFILWLVYPFVKGFHELGHAYAVKKWGGEVHEMGIMFLVFMPVPYVDATAATAFRKKRQRIIVGAVGIAVELCIASLALLFWTILEPGLLRAIAFNIILISGASALLFNGNPLLRYDGYYILSDLLDIPNLAQRSLTYLGYLINKYIFGVQKALPPYCGPGERFWFLFYALLSGGYRLIIYTGIILFVSSKFFFIGVLLALLACFNFLIFPLVKKIHSLFSYVVYQEQRKRIFFTLGASILGFLGFLFLIPLPHLSQTEGVIWVPEKSMVRARGDGVIHRIASPSNQWVKKGDLLIACQDPYLHTRIEIIRSRLNEYEARHQALAGQDQVQANIVKEEIGNIQKRLTRAEEQLQTMAITSPMDGLFVLPRETDLPGRFVQKGDVIAYILDDLKTRMRIVVPEYDVNLFNETPRKIEIRLATDINNVYPGNIIQAVPAAVERLPSSALGNLGGGKITVDPADSSGTKTLRKMFQFDLEIDTALDHTFAGSRVYVRFHHGNEPLAFRSYRRLRQLFLKLYQG